MQIKMTKTFFNDSADCFNKLRERDREFRFKYIEETEYYLTSDGYRFFALDLRGAPARDIDTSMTPRRLEMLIKMAEEIYANQSIPENW